MDRIRILAVVGAAALLSGCGAGAHSTPGTGGAGSAASEPATAQAVGASTAGSLPTGRLTMRQAEQVYQAIIGPGTVIADALARDSTPSTPYRQFRRDALAYAGELKAERGKFRSVQWPARVRPHITAIIRHDFPADIGCLQAEAAAGDTKGAQQVANTNRDCMRADNTDIPSTLQSMLAG